MNDPFSRRIAGEGNLAGAATWESAIGAPSPCAPRLGRLMTPHGVVETPAFIPVGTKAAVKGVLPETLREIGVQIVLANTYHLALRPGADVVRDLGDLHGMMGWDGPILTDSGGFQVFSLADLRKLTDDGVTFRSHIDGAEIVLTPELATATQGDLGADIVMALDVCAPYPCSRQEAEEAVRLTLAWAARCRAAHRREGQALWAIVQGSTHEDLRRMCAERLVSMDFPGYAVGGLSVGEEHGLLCETLGWTTPLLPADRARYLMGVGEPRDLVAAISTGVDMFDCVLPTRNGRNACAYTADGMIRLRNERFRTDRGPVEEGCDCPACRRFSRGAIRHFFAAGEMLGPILLSIHNLRFFMRLFERFRAAIRAGTFSDEAQGLLDRYYRNG